METLGYLGDKPPRLGDKFIGFGIALALALLWQGGVDILFASVPPMDEVDLQPGARFETRPYDGRSCPARPLKLGDWIQGPCADANLLQAPWRYRLAHLTRPSRKSRDPRWMRDRDDAVLLYCGTVTGCKVMAVVNGRFKPDPPVS